MFHCATTTTKNTLKNSSKVCWFLVCRWQPFPGIVSLLLWNMRHHSNHNSSSNNTNTNNNSNSNSFKRQIIQVPLAASTKTKIVRRLHIFPFSLFFLRLSFFFLFSVFFYLHLFAITMLPACNLRPTMRAAICCGPLGGRPKKRGACLTSGMLKSERQQKQQQQQ